MPQKNKRTLDEEQHLTELKNKKSKLEADIKGKRKLSQTEMKKSNTPSKKSKASKPVSATSAFVIPPNATLVGIDPGVRNVFGCAREDGRGWDYSSARYRHDTGETKRRRFQEKTIKKRSQQDAEFSNAFREVADARSKTTVHADLLAALQTHGKHFGTLYSLYGHRDMALIKFFNYIGSHRVLHELVKKVAPKKTDIVIVGDANFQGLKITGHPPGVAGKFVKQLIEELGPERVLAGDEFRSSCLDSKTHQLMHHPPKQPSKREKPAALQRVAEGKAYTRRVFGIYQCSSKPGYSCTWNRDVNAAINIVQNFRTLCEHGDVPEAFRRGVKLSPPPSLKYRYTWNAEKNNFKRTQGRDDEDKA